LSGRFSLLQILSDDPEYIDVGTMILKVHDTRSGKVYFSGEIRIWPKVSAVRAFAGGGTGVVAGS
jgi:hypothetical protein